MIAALGSGGDQIAASEIARYAATSALLALAVGVITATVGTITAWLTVMHDFPGRRIFTWALVLPLAVPAFALAYAYGDVFDVAGALRTSLRTHWGFDLPIAMRSVPGAAFVLGMAFYPYVYLAMRAAFLNQSVDLIDAGRMLGASRWRIVRAVALPAARPALAAGVALAVMETLAEYGALQFLSVQTLTTGIVRTWSVFGSTAGAARLALPLLAAAALLLWIERAGRRGSVQEGGRGRMRPIPVATLNGWRAAAATVTCLLPVLAGLLLPVAWLLTLTLAQAPDWTRLIAAAGRTLSLGVAGAVLTVMLATALALGARKMPYAVRLASLGYATPGAVMAIGLLVPAGMIWRGTGISSGVAVGVGLLLFAYAARLMAAALEPIEAGLARIAPSTRDGARLLGRSEMRTAWDVDLPIARGAILTAGLFVFIDIVKELPATLILRPFDFDTLAVIASNYALDERLGQAGLPSILILLLAIGPVLVLSRRIATSRPGS